MQDAGETREAFAAVKAQFICQYDMLEVKERELVRQDGKVGCYPVPYVVPVAQTSHHNANHVMIAKS